MKILIIEDEPKVSSFIKQGLEEQGYKVDIACDGNTGRNLALNNYYDLIVLDIIIPQINGVELCRQIREHNSQVKILILTALGTLEDKLTGFDVGADDYLVKPFEFLELLARIKSLSKRASEKQNKSNILKAADLELNLDTKTATRDKKKIDLTAKEFALLEYLLINKGRVVSRADIAERVWDITFDTGTNVIDVYINFLRKKIDKEFEYKMIHTLIGMGYILKDDDN